MVEEIFFQRFMGIDYGTKRIGVAISDENCILAFPKEMILNDRNLFKKIKNIIKRENITEVVVGESVNLSGKLNILSKNIEIFISELEKQFKLRVHKQKEFLTSVEARRSKSRKNDLNHTQAHSKIKKTESVRVDASAAALILQRYLDRINKQNDQYRRI